MDAGERIVMGDHRASIKIEMEFHGVKDKTDMWINYYPDSEFGIDSNIVEFIQKVYNKGMLRYNKQQEKYFEEEREKEERKQYEKLKEKYGDSPHST